MKYYHEEPINLTTTVHNALNKTGLALAYTELPVVRKQHVQETAL